MDVYNICLVIEILFWTLRRLHELLVPAAAFSQGQVPSEHDLYKALLLQLLIRVLVEVREQDGAQNYLPTCQMGKPRPPGRVIC